MLHPAYDLSFYEYDDDRDLKGYGVLLCDVVHGRPPMKPLYMGLGWYWYYHGTRYGAEMLSLPTTHGWDSRFVNGYPYITTIRTTEEEKKAREPIFREKIKPFIENFDAVWDPLKEDLLKTYKEAKESRGLREWQDIQKLSNVDLLSFFLDFAYIINRKEGEVHFIMLIASCYIAGLFQQMWRDLFGIEPSVDPAFSRAMGGFGNQITEVTRILWQLARRAAASDFRAVFENEDNAQILKDLAGTESGRQWLHDYHAFLAEHGWRSDRMHAYDTPALVEDPAYGIREVKMLMPQEVFSWDVELDRTIKEREEAVREVLGRVPEGQRGVFEVLLKATQKANYWIEDHTYYCDFYIGALGRWIVTELGRRFAAGGCIDDPEDIHFLHPNEIRKAAIPMGKINLRPYVERRKEAWERNMTIEPAPVLGDGSQAQAVLRSDPTLSVSTQIPIVREELKADLYGAAAAPGCVEGVARVVMTADRLTEMKPGEILVAPGTTTTWTVVFGLIKGVVTDGGGALSHPVIMARQCGIPCVAGCLEATAKIRTGQRIRVDGDRGVVYIMDR